MEKKIDHEIRLPAASCRRTKCKLVCLAVAMSLLHAMLGKRRIQLSLEPAPFHSVSPCSAR